MSVVINRMLCTRNKHSKWFWMATGFFFVLPSFGASTETSVGLPPHSIKTCMVIQDILNRKVIFKHDEGICDQGFPPGDTLEIPLSAMAFEQGLLKARGTPRWTDIIPRLGVETIQKNLKTYRFGNANFNGNLGDPSLKISAVEQMNFLRRMRWDFFDLKTESIDAVLKSLPVEMNRARLKIYGKLGHSSPEGVSKQSVSWYVGYIEKDNKTYTFAYISVADSQNATSEKSTSIAKKNAVGQIRSLQFPKSNIKKLTRLQWLEDFEQLKQAISTTYPNLEAKLDFEKMNLFDLNKKTSEKLKKSKRDIDSLIVLQQFLAAFHDGHLDLDWQTIYSSDASSGAKAAENKLTNETPASEACKEFTVQEDKHHKFAFPMPKDLGFSPVKSPSEFYDSTILNIDNKKVGIIRVPSFEWDDYPSVCLDEWEHYRSQFKGECGEDCRDHFKEIVLANRLLAEFEKSLKQLMDQGLSGLVLDITDNGGGNDWVEGIARILTDKPILCGSFGFIRHPHWVKNFDRDIREGQDKLAKTKDEKEKEKISEDIRQSQENLKEAQKTCERSKIWTEKAYRPQCSLLVSYIPKDCSPNSEFKFKAGLYKKPLFIMVNNHSASASEELVARYKDSGVGTLIGGTTAGAGCGHTNGGIDLRLKNSGVKISMPDCARLLRDGYNEVEKLIPDAKIDMTNMDSKDFSIRLKEYLAQALK